VHRYSPGPGTGCTARQGLDPASAGLGCNRRGRAARQRWGRPARPSRQTGRGTRWRNPGHAGGQNPAACRRQTGRGPARPCRAQCPLRFQGCQLVARGSAGCVRKNPSPRVCPGRRRLSVSLSGAEVQPARDATWRAACAPTVRPARPMPSAHATAGVFSTGVPACAAGCC